MKPNFALKLSNEGVELLHRTAGGWARVGSVDFDNDNIAEACAGLVKEAEALEPGGLRTKLVLPDSEVRYTSVVAPGPTDEARRYQIEAEIERLTPYRIDELAYDWSVEDDYALVVIAARETLIEAESFADGYGFNPVSFVAKPGAGEFSGEPFFGETMVAPRFMAQGDHVQPDAEPIREITARATPAKAPAAPAGTEAPKDAPVASAKAEAKPAQDEKPQPRPAPKADPVVPTAAPQIASPRPAPSSPVAPAPATPKPATAPPARAKVDIPPRAASPAAATGADAGADMGLARPRTPPLSPALSDDGGKRGVGSLVRRMSSRLRRDQSTNEATPPAKPALPADFATKRAVPPVRPAVAGEAPEIPTASEIKADAGTPATDKNAAMGAAKGAPKVADARSTPADTGADSVAFSSRRRPAPVVAASNAAPPDPKTGPGGRLAVTRNASAPAGLPGMAGAQGLLARARGIFAGAGTTAQSARPTRDQSHEKAAEKPVAAPPATGAASAAAATSGAPSAATPAAQPAAAALPSKPAARPAPGNAAAPVSSERPARREAPLQTTVPASRPPVNEQDKAREAEAMTIFGARGAQKNAGNFAQRGLMAAGGALLLLIAVAVWFIYFNSPDGTQIASSREETPALAESTAMAEGDGAGGIEAPETLATAEPDVAAPEALDTPEDPVTGGDALADAGEGEALSPEEQVDALVADALTEAPEADSPAETALAEATPVDQAGDQAGDPSEPQQPSPDTDTAAAAGTETATEGASEGAQSPVAIASDSPQLDSETATVQRLSLPSGMAVPPVEEVAFTPPPPPPPFGTEFVFDDRGLVVATPEGALTPSGVTVFAGRPDVVPAPRAGTVLPAAPEADAEAAPDAQPEAPADEATDDTTAPETVAEIAPVPTDEPVAAAIESAIAEAVGEEVPAPEGTAETPAEPEVVYDDTPRADPELADARPQPRPEAVRLIGEQLEAERAQEEAPGDQTSLAPEDGAQTGAASLVPAAATAVAGEDSAATRASDGAATTELAALEAPSPGPGALSLDALRPQRRPSDLVPEAAPVPELDLSGATPEAVAESPMPGARPSDVEERGREVLAAAAAAAAAAPAPAAAAPANVAGSNDPVIPSAASVARQATEEDAIRLNRINLIAVFGSPNNRRALVRMSNGRVVRVGVGDRLDGGQVAAIGESELRYVRSGRNEVLEIGG
ncbi:hypothetical protein [Pararhodobacter marinus]|uniref:hypothetical protein n=1 Tax=Pararhodobacter marinus TaxID=2184063 RepID=UPI003516DD1A